MRIARNCSNCKFADVDIFKQPCQDCDKEDAWEPVGVDQTRVMALEEQVKNILKKIEKLEKLMITPEGQNCISILSARQNNNIIEIAEMKESLKALGGFSNEHAYSIAELVDEIAELREMYDQISWDEAISLGKGMRDAELGNFVGNKEFDEEGWYIEKNGKRMWRHPVEGLMGLVGYIDRTLEEPTPSECENCDDEDLELTDEGDLIAKFLKDLDGFMSISAIRKKWEKELNREV